MPDYTVYDRVVSKHLELNGQVLPKVYPDDYVIAVAFTGHNASITVARNNEVLEVIELERFMNLKNADFSNKVWKDVCNDKYSNWSDSTITFYLSELSKYLSKKYTDEFALGIFVDRLKLPYYNINLDRFFKVKDQNWFRESHHLSHGAGAFYQTDYSKALVFTIDGGSIDGSTTAGVYERGKPIEFIKVPTNALGRAYFKFARVLEDIRYTEHGQSATYPGKLMGLAGYGIPDSKLVNLFKVLFLFGGPDGSHPSRDQWVQIKKLNYYLKLIFDNFYESFRDPNNKKRVKGKISYIIAASAQKAFEEATLDIIKPILDQYPDLPVCISGGCGLNIPFNTRIVNELKRELFVPPDPTDCGLSFGAMLNYLKPEKAINNPYLGPELLDKDMFSTYMYEEIGIDNPNYTVRCNVGIQDLASLIVKEKIIGVCNGRSERGPRALGNRSIICTVQNPNMKDIINAKVKHREWYRPFSPIVRLEDVSKYFHWSGESRFMTFSPKVKKEYIDKIKPIVHVDNTARVQTITREQNQFIYDLLTELDKQTGIGMILNTSFNVDSKPIVTTIRDAIKVLKNTELDGIYIEGTLILKNN